MATSNFINECKREAFCNRYGKLEFSNPSVEINQSNELQNFTVDGGCYDNGNIVGTVYVKKLTAQLIDALDETLENKRFDASVGVTYEEDNQEVTEYIGLGSYIVEKPKDEQTENYTSIVAYDDLINGIDKPYDCNLDFGTSKTVSDLYSDVCNNLQLTPKTLSFINSDIPIENNPFISGETNRTVLQTIAKISASYIKIDIDDGEIDLCWLSDSVEPDYTFYKSDYSTVVGGKITCGPINSLVIKNVAVDDENVSVSDTESIQTYGEHKMVIADDYILNTSALRQQAITGIWNRVHNLKYIDCELTTYLGKPFLKLGDRIRIYTDENVYFDTYVLQHTFTYDGSFTSVIKSPALTEQEIKTKQDISLGQKLMLTEISVDKQNQIISSRVGDIEAISNEAKSIASQAYSNVEGVDADLQNYKQTMGTEFSQTKTDFNFRFSTITDLIDATSNTENEHYNELHRYIRFVNGVIILGEEGNPLTAELSNSRLSFKQNGTEVAYVSDNKLYITNSEILTNLVIGNFGFIPRSNGSLSFRKVK